MSSRVFWIVFAALVAIGAALTVWHILYAFDAYQHSSIITFIAKELW